MKYYHIFRSAEPKVIAIKDGTLLQVELIIKDISFIDFNDHFNGHNNAFWRTQDKIHMINQALDNYKVTGQNLNEYFRPLHKK